MNKNNRKSNESWKAYEPNKVTPDQRQAELRNFASTIPRKAELSNSQLCPRSKRATGPKRRVGRSRWWLKAHATHSRRRPWLHRRSSHRRRGTRAAHSRRFTTKIQKYLRNGSSLISLTRTDRKTIRNQGRRKWQDEASRNKNKNRKSWW